MKLKPYPKFKDSGVPWLGDIPDHWEVMPLKHFVAINKYVLCENTIPDFQFKYIDIATVGTGRLVSQPRTEKFSDAPSRARRIIHAGDTVVSTVRTYLKAVYHFKDVSGNVIASTGFAVLTPKSNTATRYIGYCVQSEPFVNQICANSVGVAYPAISETKLGRCLFWFPKIQEQQQISRYLDWKTAQINKFIRNKRRLIQLLKEQKQNIINQAVTKGINPNVEMKDSGVEWLGQIPAHWEVRKLKYIATMKSGDNLTAIEIEEQGQYPVYGGNGIRGYYDKFNWSGSFILVGRQGALCGNVHRVRESFWATEHAVVTIPKKDICLDWYYYMLVLMNLNQYSEAAAQPGISVEKIQKLRTAVPPLNEQEQIALFIEKETALIDKTISRTEREIELIQEYRSRLVSDVVTGKLDVRGIEIPDFEPVEADLELEEDDESEGEEIDEDE